jgi:hypothetical protein
MKTGLALLIAAALVGSCIYLDVRDRDRLNALCQSFRIGQSVESVIAAAKNNPVAELYPFDRSATAGTFFFASPAMTTRRKYSCHIYFSGQQVTKVNFFEH